MGTTLVGRASHVPLNVWLRPDTFSFKLGEKGDYVEWWDYETPTKMVEAFIARVESELRRYTKS